MNSFKRVMNTLQGQPVDRPPVLAVLGAYGGRLTRTPLPELYTDSDKYVAGQQAVINTFNIDMTLSTFDFSIIAEAFGSEIVFFDHQPPNMKRPAAATADEALHTPLPDPHTTGRLPMALDATRKLAGLYKQTIPVFAILPGPVALPSLILGLETWLGTVLFDPPTAQKLLDHTARFWIQWANSLLDAGADALVVTEGMAARTVSTRKLFKAEFLPHITHCFEQISGPLVFHHTGGALNHIIDLLPALPNLAGIAVSSQDDLHEAREKTGAGIPLLGNIDELSFPSATPAEIRARATDCLQSGSEIQPHVLCNSGADIPIQTPPENIHALREAAEQFDANATVWVVCSVLGAEMQALHRQGKIKGRLIQLNSMLHMNPPELERTLCGTIEQNEQPMVLVYGDCCPGMLQLIERPNLTRTTGTNCCQLLLGKQHFRELMQREAFMLLPEWMPRWKQIIEQELGLTGEVAKELFREHRKELVYLDTGVVPIPHRDLAECSAYTGLPVRIEKTGLSHLLEALKTAQNELRKRT